MKVLKVILAILLVLFFLQREPVCYFPEERPELRDARISDINDLINKVDEGALWLFHTGSSMYPTIIDGQSCLCEKEIYYQEGDIIAFFKENGNIVNFISHRIEEVTPLGYITKGDNNPTIDYTSVPYENVICKIQEQTKLGSMLGG